MQHLNKLKEQARKMRDIKKKSEKLIDCENVEIENYIVQSSENQTALSEQSRVESPLLIQDLDDGCAVEAGFEFTEKGPVSEEELVAMRRCSPMAHVHKVKAPTALFLGSGDRRVPPYQGLEYARRLKANGVTCKIYSYDDNHSLSQTLVEMDVLINSCKWFLEHTSAEQAPAEAPATSS